MSARTVLVVGASSGIGRAAAHQLAERGDHLVLLSRSREALEETARECRLRGAGSATVVVADVRDAEAVDAAVRGVNRLDAVIHSAGVVAYGRFEDVPKDVYDGVLETNVLGAANVARSALPVLRAQKEGVLVLIGSVLGEIAVPNMTAYVVSKWALRSFGRQLAIENRDVEDVRVCVVAPGGVDTPIYRQAANYLGRPGRPPAPVDSPEKVARAAVRAIDHPRDRISVGLANPLMRFGFRRMPRVFDALVGPMFGVAALEPEPLAATTGNVHGPVTARERVADGRGQGVGTVVRNLTGRGRR